MTNSISTEENNKKILFMDDDEAIRTNMIEFGEILDFNIETVINGEDAIKKYKESFPDNKYNAVILDLTIHDGMGGEEAIKELIKIDPNVKAIVFSGHSTKPIIANYQDYGFVAKLEKPVRIDSFMQVLNKVLEM